MHEGYEDTSIEKIIYQLKIAKGTFYHYFKTKEHLLDNLVNDMTEEIMPNIIDCLENSHLNAVEKLNKIFILSRNIKAENVQLVLPLLKLLYNSNNVLMRYKMFNSNKRLVTPVIAKIIEQGNNEKIFCVEYVDETANLIMVIGNSFTEATSDILLSDYEKDEKIKRIERELKAYESVVCRILGAENGLISIVDDNIVSIFVKQ